MSFDLISSRYGWTDEQILDLTPARFRQLRSVILAAQKAETIGRIGLLERAVKELVLHIRQAAGDKKADKAAGAVRFLPKLRKPRELPSFEQVRRKFGSAPPPGG